MSMTISFIGVGNMAGVIIGGLLSSGTAAADIILYDKDPAQCARFPGCAVASSISEAAAASIVVLSVKPQTIPEVLAELAGVGIKDGTVVLSIAAGVSIGAIERALGENVPVVRVIPNALMMINCGVAALCRNKNVSDDDFVFARAMFEANGYATEVEEREINAFTALTSSSPAFVYLFLDSMIKSAAALGVTRPETLEMLCRTVAGSAQMVLKSGKTPDELVSMVATHGGTTEAAINVFRAKGWTETIIAAVDACEKRAAEIGI
jgi:pyrroline-5-carboxylate reductase